MRIMRHAAILAVGFANAVPAAAINVTLSGSVLDSCILTLTTPGTLAVDTSGTNLTSDTAGGLGSVMAVVALGSSPTINFTAPALTTTPLGFTGPATVAMRYTSLRGASQAYTSSGSSFAVGALLDTVTVNARAVAPDGFRAGNYVITTVATCQQ